MELLNMSKWTSRLSAALISGAALSALASAPVLAGTGRIENLVDVTAKESLPSLMTGISAVSYGAGALFAITGAKGAYNHVQNPTGEKLGPQVGKLVLGAALFAAPTVMDAISGGTGANTATNVSGVKAISTFQ